MSASSAPWGRVLSPCVRVCLIDEATGLCEGCGRTREEITRWSRFSDEERLRIIAALDGRMRRAFAPPTDDAG